MMTKEDLIRIESRIRDLWLDGQLPYLIHLMGGNEDQLISIFKRIKPTDYVFASHRAHYHALLHGMPEDELIRQLMDGRSMSLCWPRFVQSSIVAGTCSIAAGKAFSSRLRGSTEHVWCFLGDGASDEGSFIEAARWVDALELPCTYILENNNSSCGVSKAKRGSGPIPGLWCVEQYEYVPTYPHAGTREAMTLRAERIEYARNLSSAPR